MTPELLSVILQFIAPLIAGFLLFLLGRWWERRDKSRRQIIETGVTITRLINPDKLGPISMSVDKGFITGKRADIRKLLPVTSAYNYVVGVSNVGLDDLEKPEIDIILSEKASIIEVEVKSDEISEDRIELQRDVKRSNFRRVIPQYINRKDTLTISVLSINNTSPECKIMVGGKGIVHRVRSTSVEANQSVLLEKLLTLGIVMMVILILLWFANESLLTVP